MVPGAAAARGRHAGSDLHAVLFDMDGLMLDTEPLAARAWTVAADRLGVHFDRTITLRLIGRNFADCERLILDHHGPDYPVARLMQTWHAAYDAIVADEGIRLKPGLVELLDWLEAHAIAKAVATSTRRSRALAKLAHTGLAHRFAALVGGDEVPRGKPAPDIFVEAPGIEAALAGGMRAIMVPDLHVASAALRARPVVVLGSLHEVRAHLETLMDA